jgi:hypothetical protein
MFGRWYGSLYDHGKDCSRELDYNIDYHRKQDASHEMFDHRDLIVKNLCGIIFRLETILRIINLI